MYVFGRTKPNKLIFFQVENYCTARNHILLRPKTKLTRSNVKTVHIFCINFVLGFYFLYIFLLYVRNYQINYVDGIYLLRTVARVQKRNTLKLKYIFHYLIYFTYGTRYFTTNSKKNITFSLRKFKVVYLNCINAKPAGVLRKKIQIRLERIHFH